MFAVAVELSFAFFENWPFAPEKDQCFYPRSLSSGRSKMIVISPSTR